MEAKEPEIRIKIEDFTLDPSSRGLYRGTERIRLTAKPFEVLVYLARNRCRVVPKEELLGAVWGGRRDHNTVEQAIRQIRRALQDDKDQPRFIQTISGQGYFFIGAVEEATGQEGDAAPAAGGSVDTAGVAPPPAGDTHVSKQPWTRRIFLGISGATAAAVGASLIVGSRVRRIERAVLTGSLLTALDGLGQTIWTYRFPDIVPQPDDETLKWQVQVLDLEGDGHPGVVTVRSRIGETASVETASDEIVYLGPTGQVRWAYSFHPDLLDYDGREFAPAWRCTHLIAAPSGKQQTLWAAVRHGWRRPGCIVRFNAAGAPSIRFANSGFVERLCRLARPDGDCIAAVGENNAFDRTFAAVIGIHDAPSSSPAGDSRQYAFSNSPSGSPRDYILFPTTEMLRAVGAPYGAAKYVAVTNNGGFVAFVYASSDSAIQLLYEFSGRTEPQSVMPSSGYALVHERLRAEGKLDHSFGKCPEVSGPLTIRHWRPVGGWRDEKVPWRGSTNQR
jgi:DNA-binding winged helix-turn-helix (wHTH) protein